MGIGTITRDAGHGASSLQTWTGMVADAARRHGPPVADAAPLRFLASADAGIATVDEALVRTVGWEMRDAVEWRPDGYCVQRADLTVLSAAQRLLGGDLDAAYANVAARDGRIGAQLVAYDPRRGGLGYDPTSMSPRCSVPRAATSSSIGWSRMRPTASWPPTTGCAPSDRRMHRSSSSWPRPARRPRP